MGFSVKIRNETDRGFGLARLTLFSRMGIYRTVEIRDVRPKKTIKKTFKTVPYAIGMLLVSEGVETEKTFPHEDIGDKKGYLIVISRDYPSP